MSQQKKEEHVSLMLPVLLGIFYKSQRNLYALENTVMIFIQSLWLENTMIHIYNMFNFTLLKQALYMYL